MRLVEFLSAKQFRKLNEILSNNQIIINLKDMQIEFEDEFSLIEQSHDLLLKMKSLTRHRRLLGNIDNLRVLIQPFLDYDFDPIPTSMC